MISCIGQKGNKNFSIFDFDLRILNQYLGSRPHMFWHSDPGPLKVVEVTFTIVAKPRRDSKRSRKKSFDENQQTWTKHFRFLKSSFQTFTALVWQIKTRGPDAAFRGGGRAHFHLYRDQFSSDSQTV